MEIGRRGNSASSVFSIEYLELSGLFNSLFFILTNDRVRPDDYRGRNQS